jgi:hypothetical protein
LTKHVARPGIRYELGIQRLHSANWVAFSLLLEQCSYIAGRTMRAAHDSDATLHHSH